MENRAETGKQARALVRGAERAALGTLDAASGAPYVSLVATAAMPDGTPVLLISQLAAHTRNIDADPRVSLLFEEPRSGGDPLAGARLTLEGRAERLTGADLALAKRRYVARHAQAAGYDTDLDFHYVKIVPTGGQLVAGFGRIERLAAADLGIAESPTLTEAEPGIVAHMNEDHADAVTLYATRLLGAGSGPWRMTGCDPEGIDLAGPTGSLRLSFDAPIAAPADARKTLAALAKRARDLT